MIGEDFGIMRKGSRHTHACCIKSTSPPPHPSPLLPNISRAFAHASVASIADQSLPSISRTAFSRKHSRPIPPQHIVLISLLFSYLICGKRATYPLGWTPLSPGPLSRCARPTAFPLGSVQPN